jgi:sec-independent protein translocase protein TatB
MFGIQTSELIVIALVAVLVFGPEKVPELFHRVGRFVAKLQRSADDMWTTLQTEVNQAKQPFERIADEVKDALAEPDGSKADEAGSDEDQSR